MSESTPANPSRRHSATALASLGLLGWASGAPLAWAQGESAAAKGADAPPKVLRYAFRVAETGFDPARISDLYSRIVTPHIFEGLYHYDHLARPAKLKPLTAAALPEASADFRSFSIRLRPGIFFADDPAFGGKPRELVAADYVFAIKRFADPANLSPAWGEVEDVGFVGLGELREQALKQKKPFDYEREVPGLRATDRYTLRLELAQPRPRLIEFLAQGDLFGAVAHEVVKAYGDKLAEHPVGTGPFVLTQWRRSSLIVLSRNPGFREMLYDAEPNPADAEGQALLARFKGRRLPMVDRVEVSIIEENQPRWLSFLNQQHDVLDRVPEDFINVAMPGGKIAPNLAHQGIRGIRTLSSDVLLTMFNMEDPVVGGYTADKIALRRAINLALDISREIRLVRRGQAIVAQSLAVPHTTGYDPAFKSEMGDFDPARARALLDLHGYVDRDGDGWREQPDGSPLKLVRATQPDQLSRQLDELWQRNLNAVGLKIEFKTAKWPENLKAAQAGKLMMWGVGSLASQMDGKGAFERMYGPASGGANLARFRHAGFDALYNRLTRLPDGPEREAIFREIKRIGVAFAPYKNHAHRLVTDLVHPWVIGYRRPLFWNEWWQYVDVAEPAGRQA